MPAWIVITVDDLDDYLAAAAMSALRSAALGTSQTDPFARVMPDIASRIRNEIQACASNRISATTNAIPPELKTIACLMIIEAMQARLPGVDLTEKQQDMLRDGRDYLKRIANCEISVSDPTDPVDPDVASGQVEIVSSRTRNASAAKLDGL